MADSNFNERQLLKTVLGRTERCLPPEILASMAAGSAEDAAAVEDRAHLAACSRCQSELALFSEFESAIPRPEEAADVAWVELELRRRAPELLHPHPVTPVGIEPHRGGLAEWFSGMFQPRHWKAWSLAGASLMVAVAVAVVVRPQTETAQAPGDGLVWRSQQFETISPAGEIAAPPARLSWQPVDGATRYEVRLMEVDRHAIWTAQSSVSSLEIPTEVGKQLTPARTFLWDVSAYNAEGRKIGGTNLQNFHIAFTSR